ARPTRPTAEPRSPGRRRPAGTRPYSRGARSWQDRGRGRARAGRCVLCYNNIVYGIIVIIDRIVSLLTYLIIIRALLSWIPSVDYRHPLMSLLIRVTDPVLVPEIGRASCRERGARAGVC